MSGYPYANEEPSPNYGGDIEDRLFRQKCDLFHALEAVVSALEDVGMDNSHVHQIATQALKAAA